MYQWQPLKWLILAPVMAGLPTLAGFMLQSTPVENQIAAQAQKAAGDWAKLQLNGRDITVTGQANDQMAVDKAIKSLLGTYGVRTVDASGIKIVPLPPLVVPTVTSVTTNQNPPEIKGSWAEGEAKSLTVTLNGKTYTLGTDKDLTSASGSWTLKPAEKLADGKYGVTVSENDGGSRKAEAASPGAVILDTAPPAAPALVATAPGASWPYAVTGTWAEGDAKGLSIKLLDKSYVLGTDPALTSDGKGNFSFDPKIDLKPGSYDLEVTATDAAGNASTTTQKGAIVVAEPPPPPLAAPTLDSVPSGTVWPYALTGSWPEGPAKSLALGFAGRDYVLGKDKEVISAGQGKFTFAPVVDLKPGSYDLAIKLTDAAGKITETDLPGVVVVAEPPKAEPAPAPAKVETSPAAPAPAKVEPAPAPPAPPPAPLMTAPTVDSISTDSDRPTITGTWPVGIAKGFAVELDGVIHTLGKDTDILTDTAGHWTLKPAKPLVNGTYDVIAQANDGNGKTITDASTNEVTVKVAPPPPPPPADQPYDCNATLARIAAVFPVRFEYDHFDLKSPYAEAVNQYSALLGDPRCKDVKVQVAGHADERGSEAYNQKLSEKRAQTVIDALVAAKIDVGRMTGIGFSKNKPLDPAHTQQAHAKNRRVEFSIQ